MLDPPHRVVHPGHEVHVAVGKQYQTVRRSYYQGYIGLGFTSLACVDLLPQLRVSLLNRVFMQDLRSARPGSESCSSRVMQVGHPHPDICGVRPTQRIQEPNSQLHRGSAGRLLCYGKNSSSLATPGMLHWLDRNLFWCLTVRTVLKQVLQRTKWSFHFIEQLGW